MKYSLENIILEIHNRVDKISSVSKSIDQVKLIA